MASIDELEGVILSPLGDKAELKVYYLSMFIISVVCIVNFIQCQHYHNVLYACWFLSPSFLLSDFFTSFNT